MLVTTPIWVGEPREGAVALVGLDDHPLALAEPRRLEPQALMMPPVITVRVEAGRGSKTSC